MVASLIAAIHLQQKQYLLHITVQVLHTHLHTHTVQFGYFNNVNPLNAELKPIRHFLALLGAHHILHISSIRVNKM
jgi:hypothetical protein